MRDSTGSLETTEGFRIDEERPDPETVVVSVRGDADLSAAGDLKEFLGDVVDEAPSEVVLDLSQATFVDSTVLGVLVSTMRRLRASGAAFKVVSPAGEIRRVLELTSLDRVLRLYRSRSEALGDARRGRGGRRIVL